MKRSPRLLQFLRQSLLIPIVVDAQAALASNEGEVAAEFEEKSFQMANEGVFEFGLGVLVAKAKEFEDERIADIWLV